MAFSDVAVSFGDGGNTLGVSGGDTETVVHLTLPAPRKLAVAGSGRMTARKLARDGKISIAGSGRLEVAALRGVVFATLRPGEVLRTIGANLRASMRLCLLDNDAPAASRVLTRR